MEMLKDNIYKHIEASRQILLTYIKKQNIDCNIKELLFKEINSEPNLFYFCYGSLFTEKRDKEINQINISGYFYFKYLLILDKKLDTKNDNPDRIHEIILSNWYHEESIKILSSIFQDNQRFWGYWQERKKAYLSAYYTDKQFILDLKKSEFENLADRKSAFGKIAIDSLFTLNKISLNNHQKLLKSHRLFSCGLQCYDDLFDLNVDYNNKQTNFALSTLLKKNKLLINKPIEHLQKKMFVNGYAVKLLNQSISYLAQAAEICSEINCTLWKLVIEMKITEIRQVLTQVEFYLESIKIKNKRSIEKIKIADEPTAKKSILQQIKSGLNFIQKEQERNGAWRDSPVNGWLSGYWTTGYVLYQLEEFENHRTNNIIPKAIEYLHQKKNILWPYIEGWVEDADSSNFSLLGLISQYKSEEVINAVLSYQQNDGGITTYNNRTILLNHLNDPKKKNINGWTQSHLCVSAGTLLLLSKFDGYTQEKNKLIAYFLKKYKANQLFESYWWTSPIYSSTLLLEANKNLQHPELQRICQSTAELLFEQIQDNGLCKDAFSNEHILYTAMTLKALSHYKEWSSDQYHLLKKSAIALINRQNTDGSWDSSYALRIPASDCINPEDITEWKKTDIGENVLIEDLHRIITTSTVISALNRFLTLKH